MTTQAGEATQVQEIAISKIDVHRLNPRDQEFKGEEFEGLVESIRAQGVVQPVIAVRDDGGYALVDGSRRLAAARRAGRTTIPVIVQEGEVSDELIAELALTSNLQREDLTPLEEARGYKAWLDLTKKTQAELAKRVGKGASTIANTLRLLEAPKPVQDALASGSLSAAGAKVVLSVPETARALIDFTTPHSVAELSEQATRAQRSARSYARLAAAVEKARAAGKVVAWKTKYQHDDRMLYLDGSEYDPEKLFGKSTATVQGWLHSSYLPVHRQVCKCDAVGIQGDQLQPACVSPEGWKKTEARERANVRGSSPKQKKKVQSAKAKEARLRRVITQSVKEAAKAFEGRALVGWRAEGITAKVEPQLLKAGLAGEPARLALFGFLAKFSDSRGPMWKLELWKKIQAAPLADVRARVTQYALGQGMAQITRASSYGDKYHNTAKIRALVKAHYAPRRAAKAKR